jgi:hypothetical protein
MGEAMKYGEWLVDGSICYPDMETTLTAFPNEWHYVSGRIQISGPATCIQDARRKATVAYRKHQELLRLAAQTDAYIGNEFYGDPLYDLPEETS